MIHTAQVIIAFLSISSSSVSATLHPQIELPKMADSLRGYIMTDSGQPITEAIVALFVPGDTQAITKTRTSATGEYTIVVPFRSKYIIRVLAIGYRPATSVLRWQKNNWMTPDVIVMHSFVTITGVIDTGDLRHSSRR